MSGIDPNGGGALVVPGGGASLPTASAAGQVPVSDGAGSAYTATSAGDVLALGMVAALTGEPAGVALISDGAGDIATTSADVSAMLACANNAAILAAIGAGGGATVTQRPFNATHWTIVAASTPSEGVATLEAGDVGRVSITSTANVYGIAGPRLERAWPASTRPGEPVRVRVTVDAKVGTGTAFGQLYIRSGSTVWTIGARTNNDQVFSYNWSSDIVNVASLAVWDGTMTLDIYVAGGNVIFAAEIGGTRTYLRVPATQHFWPTHWGVEIGGDGAVTGSVDYVDAVEEVG